MKATQDTDALISKFLAGEASPEEAMQLEDWKSESPANQAYFNQSAAVFGLLNEAVDTEAAWTKVQPQLQQANVQQAPIRKLKPNFGLRIAAALVALFAIGTLIVFLLPSANDELVFTAQATKKDVKLSDGTAVTIAANSSVELAEGYGKNNRSLKLKGSGYFSVKHSEQLPFVIETGPIKIKDLGTKFDVRSTDDTIFVRVDEGVVMIYDNAGMKITLKANESAHYVIATGELELEVQTNVPSAEPKTFVFDNQRLEDVVDRLNSVYQADIRIENPQVRKCLITTQFSNEKLEVVLSVIGETLHLTVEKQGTTYLLKGESCTQ